MSGPRWLQDPDIVPICCFANFCRNTGFSKHKVNNMEPIYLHKGTRDPVFPGVKGRGHADRCFAGPMFLREPRKPLTIALPPPCNRELHKQASPHRHDQHAHFLTHPRLAGVCHLRSSLSAAGAYYTCSEPVCALIHNPRNVTIEWPPT